jgi:hypothetical protein
MRDETVNMTEESIFDNRNKHEKIEALSARQCQFERRAKEMIGEVDQSFKASASKAAMFLPRSDHQFMAMSSIAHNW